MPTTVHIPPRILKAVDRQAKALKISRNRFVIEALERRLAEDAEQRPWPEGFFERMAERARDPEYRRSVDALFAEVIRSRRSKPVLKL
jgi:hypothetical protein